MPVSQYVFDGTDWVDVAGGGTPPPPDVQDFTTSGTWVKPEGAVLVWFECVGGGGAQRGGGGAYGDRLLAADDVGATETVTIGAGSVTTTSKGGDTSVGTLVTAPGGYDVGAAAPNSGRGGGPGGPGGDPKGGPGWYGGGGAGLGNGDASGGSSAFGAGGGSQGYDWGRGGTLADAYGRFKAGDGGPGKGGAREGDPPGGGGGAGKNGAPGGVRATTFFG